MKYNLQNNPILYPYQIKILSLFSVSPFAKPFFLTGGTALAAFYLGHRESQDLDFFSLEPFDPLLLQATMQEIADKTNSELITTRRFPTYHEIFIENKKEGWKQKIDIVQEQPKRFGEVETVDGIRVDALINIATNKILAIFGRLEPKDYLDLYTILMQTDLRFNELFELAWQKDLGLSEFYFANTIADVEQFKTLPNMKIDFDKNKFVQFYKDLSKELLLKIKPQE